MTGNGDVEVLSIGDLNYFNGCFNMYAIIRLIKDAHEKNAVVGKVDPSWIDEAIDKLGDIIDEMANALRERYGDRFRFDTQQNMWYVVEDPEFAEKTKKTDN